MEAIVSILSIMFNLVLFTITSLMFILFLYGIWFGFYIQIGKKDEDEDDDYLYPGFYFSLKMRGLKYIWEVIRNTFSKKKPGNHKEI